MSEESGKLDIDGFCIYYKRLGTGECTVLLMPGALGSLEVEFDKQIKGFDTSKFTLVLWDAPGFGKSRPPERDYNDCYNRDASLAVKLMKQLGYERFHLMGFSDGGRTSLALAANYPDVVIKLVVWGAATFNDDKIKKTLELCRDVSGWTRDRLTMYEAIYGNDLQDIWGKWVDENNKLDDYLSDCLTNITCPTFILHGDNDIIAPVEPHALFLKKKIKNSRLIIFPKVPHNVHQEKTPEFNRLVQEFLLKNDS